MIVNYDNTVNFQSVRLQSRKLGLQVECLIRLTNGAVVIIKWLTCLPANATIRVQIPPKFTVLLCKQTLQFFQQIYVKNVMTIKYTLLGFKSTTFGTRVSSHNHQTRAPARKNNFLKDGWNEISTGKADISKCLAGQGALQQNYFSIPKARNTVVRLLRHLKFISPLQSNTIGGSWVIEMLISLDQVYQVDLSLFCDPKPLKMFFLSNCEI